MKVISALALQITATKNPQIFMVGTKQQMFPVRKAMLDKRGIIVPTIGAYKFPELTVVVAQVNQVGDWMFTDGTATQDSSRNTEKGLPYYKTGDKVYAEGAKNAEGKSIAGQPLKYTEEIATVRSFVGFNEFKAQLELEKLMATA